MVWPLKLIESEKMGNRLKSTDKHTAHDQPTSIKQSLNRLAFPLIDSKNQLIRYVIVYDSNLYAFVLCQLMFGLVFSYSKWNCIEPNWTELHCTLLHIDWTIHSDYDLTISAFSPIFFGLPQCSLLLLLLLFSCRYKFFPNISTSRVSFGFCLVELLSISSHYELKQLINRIWIGSIAISQLSIVMVYRSTRRHITNMLAHNIMLNTLDYARVCVKILISFDRHGVLIGIHSFNANAFLIQCFFIVSVSF